MTAVQNLFANVDTFIDRAIVARGDVMLAYGYTNGVLRYSLKLALLALAEHDPAEAERIAAEFTIPPTKRGEEFATETANANV